MGKGKRSNAKRGRNTATPMMTTPASRRGRAHVITPTRELPLSSYDNQRFSFVLVAPGNSKLTCCFQAIQVAEKTFPTGIDNDRTHDTAKQAILDIVLSTFEKLLRIRDGDVVSTFEHLVNDCYRPTSNDHQAFSFAPRFGTQSHFTFPAATKFLKSMKPDPNSTIGPVIVCLLPERFVDAIHMIAESILHDDPADDYIGPMSPLLSPPLCHAFETHHNMVKKGMPQYESFMDSLSIDRSGNWFSDIVLMTAMDGSGKSQLPPDKTPTDSNDPPPSDSASGSSNRDPTSSGPKPNPDDPPTTAPKGNNDPPSDDYNVPDTDQDIPSSNPDSESDLLSHPKTPQPSDFSPEEENQEPRHQDQNPEDNDAFVHDDEDGHEGDGDPYVPAHDPDRTQEGYPLYYETVVSEHNRIWYITLSPDKKTLQYREAAPEDDGHLILVGGYYCLIPWVYTDPGQGHRPVDWLLRGMYSTFETNRYYRIYGRPRPPPAPSKQPPTEPPLEDNPKEQPADPPPTDESEKAPSGPPSSFTDKRKEYDDHVGELGPDKLGRHPDLSVQFDTSNGTSGSSGEPPAVVENPGPSALSLFDESEPTGSGPSLDSNTTESGLRPLNNSTTNTLDSIRRGISGFVNVFTPNKNSSKPAAKTPKSSRPARQQDASNDARAQRALEDRLRAEKLRRDVRAEHQRQKKNRRTPQDAQKQKRPAKPTPASAITVGATTDGTVSTGSTTRNFDDDFNALLQSMLGQKRSMNQRFEAFIRDHKIEDAKKLAKALNDCIAKSDPVALGVPAETITPPKAPAPVPATDPPVPAPVPPPDALGPVDPPVPAPVPPPGNPHVGGRYWRGRYMPHGRVPPTVDPEPTTPNPRRHRPMADGGRAPPPPPRPPRPPPSGTIVLPPPTVPLPVPPTPPHSVGSSPPTGPIPEGIDWRYFRVDPRTLDEATNFGNGTCAPWRYLRPETHSRINHPVRMKVFLCSRDRMMEALEEQRLGTEAFPMKNFLYNFPKLAKASTPPDILEFLGHVSRYCLGTAVYVPPLHTYNYNNHTGEWYDYLPDHCVHSWDFYDEALHQALVKYGNLSDSDTVSHLITETSGYEILWQLAQNAGHPALALGVVSAPLPRQKGSQSLAEYLRAWRHFLLVSYLKGEFLSDRYFLETFIEHMHSSFDHGVKGHLISLLRDIPVDRRVQDQWRIPKLVGYICSVAKRFHGNGNLSPTTAPRDLNSNRGSRNHSTPGQAIRSITDTPAIEDVRAVDIPTSSTSSTPPLMDIRQTSLVTDLDIYAAICEISLANQRTCDLCGAQDHFIASCPRLVRLLKDPVACKRVLNNISKHLSPQGGSPNMATPLASPRRNNATPPRNNRSQPVRAILQDDDTDTDNTANDTDDEADFQ